MSDWEYKDPGDSLLVHLREAGCDPESPMMRHFAHLWTGIQDLPRHLGQHSGGMVVCAGRLDGVVPLEPASMPDRSVVQWDKDDCAAMGIIKVDLLGLGMMALLEDALEMIRRRGGHVDLAHLPTDPVVYAMLKRADTIGVFQVESRAQMATLPRLKPECFYDLVVQVAIIRPGPIVGDMVHPYLRRRAGRERITVPHPVLEPILERTLGVPLFQEQLLRMAMAAAGFTGGEAEELRRAFGFKRRKQAMEEVEKKLRAGMTAKGITGRRRKPSSAPSPPSPCMASRTAEPLSKVARPASRSSPMPARISRRIIRRPSTRRSSITSPWASITPPPSWAMPRATGR